MSDIYSKACGVLVYLGAPKATRDPYAGFLATAALAGLGGEFKSLEKASGFDSAAGIVPDTAPRDYRDPVGAPMVHPQLDHSRSHFEPVGHLSLRSCAEHFLFPAKNLMDIDTQGYGHGSESRLVQGHGFHVTI